ncbi:IgGFc-binding protein [Myxocyprinus asiaticus]|uniref:IgGFc-binding protein n=1 Tax=Myxocyprinus asiaticus TaxID=70543 RepID=UPI00222363CB|nr:IgGFc-binding protein [Myxocyprinus asiaticus]XP_051577906.1 IgGFc-binding protein [Myxocyprinus asiaticus]
MFAILLIASLFCQGLTIVSYGDNFITAFPENIGYFYPHNSMEIIRVTALHDNTTFNVIYRGTQKTISISQSGETSAVTIQGSFEVNQLNQYNKSVRITSDKNITVVSYSCREDSVQTNVVQPTTNLGTNYLIPSLNYTELLASFTQFNSASGSMRYSTFKLLIINAVGNENNITLFKKTETDIEEETLRLEAYQLFQVLTNGSVVRVESSHEIAVILTHPCAETAGCTCNMVVNQILPTKFQGQNFVVPSILNTALTELLVATDQNTSSLFYNSTQLQPISNSSMLLPFPYLQTASQYLTASENVSVRLLSPGLIMELIPENMFSACYLLQFFSSKGQAFVIAETDSRDDVHIQDSPLSAQWTEITGTKYSSAIVTLNYQTAVIWHRTSRIAVYMLDSRNTIVFGGPAISINERPDYYGCVVMPGQFQVGNDKMTWLESREYCMTTTNQFACPINEDMLKDMTSNLSSQQGQVWIGLRRSLLTTELYWQDESENSPPVTYVNWASNKPQKLWRGLCMSMDPENEFKWKNARCCNKKKPVCYKRPNYLTPSQIITTSSW